MSMLSQMGSQYELLCYALDHIQECIVITDFEGAIIYINKSYKKFLNADDEVLGMHVTEVIENSRMHIVAKTGEKEIAQVQRIQGHDMIANRIPILREGKVEAVIGTMTFRDVKQLYALTATIQSLFIEIRKNGRVEAKRKSRKAPILTTSFSEIIGVSNKLNELKTLAKRVSKSDTSILIIGESGTGKELLAKAIHTASDRGMGPFITVNCAAIPDNLLESELFGYEGGAFTGAVPSGKKGKFELAHHGTILLDEIGDMPLNLQAKILRVLEEREVERVGAVQPIPIDVRVISSTHRNLMERTREGKFRDDLFYRLNVLPLQIPPLRDRLTDIRPLVNSILEKLKGIHGVENVKIENAVWIKLNQHKWPGNVRELRNTLERAVHLMDGDELLAKHVTFPLEESIDLIGENKANELCLMDTAGVAYEGKFDRASFVPLKASMFSAEKSFIKQALRLVDGNKQEAARLLGISRSSLYQKLSEHQVE